LCPGLPYALSLQRASGERIADRVAKQAGDESLLDTETKMAAAMTESMKEQADVLVEHHGGPKVSAALSNHTSREVH
jgi:tetraacyldisaccharide-1-P 4'-kinase